MSALEETLERIRSQPGVEGYVICNHDGIILRRLPTMTQPLAESYAQSMKQLAQKARNVVRDLEPRNELQNFRIRTKRNEIIVAYEREFIVIIVQQWTPAAVVATMTMTTTT